MSESFDHAAAGGLEMFEILDCTVYPDSHLIRRGGEEIRVPHKVMAALVCLVTHRGRVVTKSELIDEVWDGAFTSDEVISTTIYELRKALGDDARSPRYVETIRKSGYRLVAAVRESEAPGATHAAGRMRRPLLVLASLCVIASALGLDRLVRREPGAADAQAAQPVPAAACEAYLEGRQFLALDTQAGLRKAVDAFQRAIRVDSTLSMAHVALAECFTTGDWGLLGLDWAAAHARALAATERALSIDANDPLARASLASIHFFHEWDWARADATFASCLTMTSCNPEAGSRRYAMFLSAMGRHAEAIEHLERVVAIDPTSLQSKVRLAKGYYRARRLEEARDLVESMMEIHANEPAVHEFLGDIHAAAGRHQDADRAYRRSIALADIARSSGETGEGPRPGAGAASVQDRRIADERGRVARGASPVRLARLLSQAGQCEEAVARLSSALDERRADIVWIKEDPAFDPLRSREGFEVILGRLGL